MSFDQTRHFDAPSIKHKTIRRCSSHHSITLTQSQAFVQEIRGADVACDVYSWLTDGVNGVLYLR